MTDPKPIACTLDENALSRRLDKIATLGTESLLHHERKDDTHTLRFRRDDWTRRQLEEIVAAEARCCLFLDLAIDERDRELILKVDAPTDGRSLADELVSAFSATRPIR